MSGTASGLYMNWTGVTVTPPSPASAITIDEVVEVDFGKGGEMKPWYADACSFAKALKQVHRQRTCTIMGGNVAKLGSIPDNTPCTIVAVLNDLNNGTSTGAITFTLINAVLRENPFKGQNSEYATGHITFEAFSTDGTTDPLSSAVAS